jgi:hypothetical protein
MEAQQGDKLVVKGRRVGQPTKNAEILEVRGRAGGPPYYVRWADDGREALVFPGPDATVHHLGAKNARPGGS